MATNKYFDLYKTPTNEQTLYRDMFAEAVQIYGQDVNYIVRNIENEDYLFKEDVLSSFDESYVIEMYLESFDGFEGDDIIAKFGFQVTDNMVFSVSVDRFVIETGLDMPNEGDLVYLPLSKSLFEIKYVEHEQQFYPIGTLPAFKLRCELFRYDNQEFGTGVPEIDGVIEMDKSDVDNIDPFGSDSDELQNEADVITDKSEINPFGNY